MKRIIPRWSGLLLAGVLTLWGFGSSLAIAADTAVKTETTAAASKAQGEKSDYSGAKQVIFTPKSYRAEIYQKLPLSERMDALRVFTYYCNKKMSIYDWAKPYGDFVTATRTIRPDFDPDSEYAYVVYYKDRGEKQNELDKKVIKDILNSYDGVTCRVLLAPIKYSYFELKALKEELDKVLKPYDNYCWMLLHKLEYVPSEDPAEDEAVARFIKENDCEEYIIATRSVNVIEGPPPGTQETIPPEMFSFKKIEAYIDE